MKAFLYKIQISESLEEYSIDEMYVPDFNLCVNDQYSSVGTSVNKRCDSSTDKKEIELTPEQVKNCTVLALFIVQKNQVEQEVRKILHPAG